MMYFTEMNTKMCRYSLLLGVLFYGVSFGAEIPSGVLAIFEKGVSTYDTALVKKALAEGRVFRDGTGYLFQATCLWRIQLVKSLVMDKKGSVQYGKQSLDLLDSAERAGADRFSVLAVRAFVSQLLSAASAANGAVYGPRTGKYLSALQKMRPGAYETRLVDAFNKLEAPAFVGGNPVKALESFTALHTDFPESTVVTINLAQALVKLKRYQEADSLCAVVLKKAPQDLWAKKVRAGIKKKSS